MLDLDEALDRFHKTDVEYAGGLSNHGPMAAEALVTLGHGVLVIGVVDHYAPRLPPARTGRPLSPDEEPAALGQIGQIGDWIATLDTELARRPWRDVVRKRCAALLPGIFAAAGHGWLRTAHAIRALEAQDSPSRRRELARGLAYWAARHQILPGGAPRTKAGAPRPAQVLEHIPPVPREARRPGLFFDAVRVLDDHPAFGQGVAHIDTSDAALDRDLSDLCAAAARLYLEHPQTRIAHVHCVTATSALRIVGPYLDPETRVGALLGLTQVAAALHAISAQERPDGERDADDVTTLARSRDEIRYRAACSLEEHAIKMAEACLREHAHRPDPVFLEAAADAALRIEPLYERAC